MKEDVGRKEGRCRQEGRKMKARTKGRTEGILRVS
jgi:hypothetical protein